MQGIWRHLETHGKQPESNLEKQVESSLAACVCVRAHVCLIVYNDEMSDAVELLLWKLQL